MIRPKAAIPITRQCQVLDICRSTAYYRPKPVPAKDLLLMQRLDKLHMVYPFAGTRMLRDLLRQEEKHVNRKRVQRLTRLMGLSALSLKKNTSMPFKRTRFIPICFVT